MKTNVPPYHTWLLRPLYFPFLPLLLISSVVLPLTWTTQTNALPMSLHTCIFSSLYYLSPSWSVSTTVPVSLKTSSEGLHVNPPAAAAAALFSPFYPKARLFYLKGLKSSSSIQQRNPLPWSFCNHCHILFTPTFSLLCGLFLLSLTLIFSSHEHRPPPPPSLTFWLFWGGGGYKTF